MSYPIDQQMHIPETFLYNTLVKDNSKTSVFMDRPATSRNQ